MITTGTILGLIAGVIFTLLVLLIELIPRRKTALALVALCLITPLALGGFWFSLDKLGISDWDYYFSYHHSVRETLTRYHVFPFWNPYTCGGTAGLADPEFPLFTMTFLAELLFGIPNGLRLAIFISTAVGACGMFMLGKRLNLSTPGALLAALGTFFGSVNLLEIVEGHPNILAAMWIPWIFYSWYSAYQDRNSKLEIRNPKQILNTNYKWVILCAIFLALTFYAGGIYLLMYTGMAFLALILAAKNKRVAIIITLVSGTLALGLSAVKLVPAALWLSQFPDQAYASSINTLPYLHEILLGRYLHTTQDIIPNQGSGWHEYGAYIGPVISLLALWGGLANWRKSSTVKFLGLAAILAVLISAAGPLLKPLFDIASFLPRSNISRFVLFAVIPLSLLAGFGLDTIRRRVLWKSAITVIIVSAAASDLMTLAYPLSLQAFVLPDVIPAPSPAPSPIAYSAHTFSTRYAGADYTRAYAATRAGYGSLSYCSVLSPNPAVRTIHDEIDTGILSVKTADNQFGSWQLQSWNPNTVKATVTLPAPGQAILNTNYAKGWEVKRSSGSDLQSTSNQGAGALKPRTESHVFTSLWAWLSGAGVNGRPAIDIAGRVGVNLPAGTHNLTFTYSTPGFPLGLSFTTLTVVTIVGISLAKKI